MSTKRQTARADVSGHVVVWFGFFMLFSCGMTLANKLIMRRLGTPYCVLLVQTVVGMALNAAMAASARGDASSPWHMKPFSLEQARPLVVVAINFTVMLGSSLKALPLVAVATVVVARNLCTVLIALGEFVFLRQKFSAVQIVALLCTLGGSLLYARFDITFTAEGYFWQGINSACFCFGQLYEKWNMQHTQQTPAGVAQLKGVLSVPVIVAMAVLLDEPADLQSWRAHAADGALWALLAFTCVGACAMGIIYMSLYVLSSATAVSMGGNFNKVVSIVLAAMVFNTTLDNIQMLGLAVCITGSALYSVASIRNKHEQSSVSKKRA